MAKKPTDNQPEILVDSYNHRTDTRKNNPPVGLVNQKTDKLNGKTRYEHDPHIDPYLSWAGKKESESFEVQNVSLHVHERIDSNRIIQSFLKKEKEGPIQPSLFDNPVNDPPLNKAIDFYSHDQEWTNRMIAGDSLLVMHSLLKKEGMANSMQLVFIDPPYGISFNTNFQPFINQRTSNSAENEKDLSSEPEMINAFRDTWHLGIHSYLTMLHQRLHLARELIREEGSCIVQISDENLHYIRNIMDEVFGKENFIGLIPFRKKTMPFGANFMEQMYDFLIWYGKNKPKTIYNKIFTPKNVEGDNNWRNVELPDGTTRSMTKAEVKNHGLLPKGSRIYMVKMLSPSGVNESGKFPFEFNGKTFPHPSNGWATDKPGMDQLLKLNRIDYYGKSLGYKLYLDDYPVKEVTSPWTDVAWKKFVENKIYVVQTATDVIKRCVLMTTNPGDLVFDPTCGSGTTAFISEQYGRRWITCDTSRVAITLSKQRMMTALYNYYKLAHPHEGVKSGFEYEKASHITLGSLAKNEQSSFEYLYDKPLKDNKIDYRVSGPFTVEAVPCIRTKTFSESESIDNETFQENNRQSEWIDELKATGVVAAGGKKLEFGILEPMKATQWLSAEGEIRENKNITKKAVVCFGPDFGPLEQRQVEGAILEAHKLKDKPDFILFAAFHFDPEAAKDIDEAQKHDNSVQILKIQMSADLLTADLRKKRASNQSYWLIGQPDVTVKKVKGGMVQVKVNGFDYYDPVKGEIISKDNKHIAMWYLDTDYDDRSVYPDQVFFPEGDSKRDWSNLAKALNGNVDEEALEAFSGVESLPFKTGEHKKIAVKIIDYRGIESIVIKEIA